MLGSVQFDEELTAERPIHVVQRGEYLSQIALEYNMTVGQLLKLNEIENPSLIHAGQRLAVVDIEKLVRGNEPIVRDEPWWGEVIVGSVPIRPAAVNCDRISDPERPGLDRILYGTDTVQVVKTVEGEEIIAGNDKWYKIEAEEEQYVYSAYVKPKELPEVPEVGEPLGPGTWIAVYLAQQLAVAYEGDGAVYVTLVSTGKAYPTPLGVHYINGSRRPVSRRMRGGEPGTAAYYDLPKVQYVSYFTGEWHALHGTYWHHRFGQPMSHGCVNMTNYDARFFYEWAPGSTAVVVMPG
jgi:hypothetical protein